MPVFDLDTSHPFTRADATAAGLTSRMLAGPEFRRIFPAVFVSSAVPDTLVVRSRAALLIAPPKGSASHATAARLWGATPPADPAIHLSYVGNVRMPPDGIKVHRFNEPFAVARRHGLPVTSPEQTFVHCAVRMPLLDLVAVGDRFIKRHPNSVTSQGALAAYAGEWSGQGGRRARQAADLLRVGVDSNPESHLRLLMVLAGLPEPAVNVGVGDAAQGPRYRLDLAYREIGLAIEYDGRWHTDAEQTERDLVRRRELQALGWTFLIVVADELYGDPHGLLLRIRLALAELGVHVPTLNDAWRLHMAQTGLVA